MLNKLYNIQFPYLGFEISVTNIGMTRLAPLLAIPANPIPKYKWKISVEFNVKIHDSKLAK